MKRAFTQQTTDGEIVCLKCNTAQAREHFYKTPKGRFGIKQPCKSCYSLDNKQYRETRTAEQKRAAAEIRHIAHVRRRYGIDKTSYDRLFEKQSGVCAVCGGCADGRRLHLDHDHETNEIRGLLCAYCNPILGLAHDDPALLRKLALYLEIHQNG